MNTTKSRYAVTLTFAMIVALVDIKQKYEEQTDEKPSPDGMGARSARSSAAPWWSPPDTTSSVDRPQGSPSEGRRTWRWRSSSTPPSRAR